MSEQETDYLYETARLGYTEIYEHEINSLTVKNKELEKTIDELSKQLKKKKEGPRTNVITISPDISSSQIECQRLEEEIKYLNQKIIELRTTISETEKYAEKHRKQATELADELEQERENVADLQEQIYMKSKQITALIKNTNVGFDRNSNSASDDESIEIIKQKLIDENLELDKMLIDVKLEAKMLVENATKQAKMIKFKAEYVSVEKSKHIRKMKDELNGMKVESEQCVTKLFEDIKTIFH